MNVRDPKFTARLEDALTILANQPTRALHYLEDRFELETGDLQAWLAEFNGGQKALKFDRIHAVKRELGGITVTKAKAAAPAAVMRDAPETAHKRIPAAPRAEAAALLEPVTNIADDGATPWTDRQFRQSAFTKWLPTLQRLVGGESAAVAGEFRTSHRREGEAYYMYVTKWIGGRRNPAAKIQRFLAWGVAQCAARAGESRPAAESPAAAAAAAPVVTEPRAGDAWQQWRADAIAALVAMGTKTRQATLQVDAAIRKLAGEDVETGELVKLAMREVPAAAPVERRAAKISAKAVGAESPMHVCVNGASFKLEMTVRLVPVIEEVA